MIRLPYKMLLFWVAVLLVLVMSVFVYTHRIYKNLQSVSLPFSYRNQELLAQFNLDQYMQDAQLLILNKRESESPKEFTHLPFSLFSSRAIVVVDDERVIELEGGGNGLEWAEVTHLLVGKPYEFAIAVMYQGGGSAHSGAFYVYGWDGEKFDVLLHNQDIDNRNELVDLDGDFVKEVIHTYRLEDSGDDIEEIYTWGEKDMRFINGVGSGQRLF